jgi:acetyltransferase-like isoleucine patch superfamily enzyme
VGKGLFRRSLKSFILAFPLTRTWYAHGYFCAVIRRQKIVNHVFKVLFRMNVECPWSIHYTSRVVGPEKLKIGQGVEHSLLFSGGCYIEAGNGIEIGDGTIFAPGVKLISSNHDTRDPALPCVEAPPIRIGKSCWLGTNVVILPGVEIGDNVTVGAGAVVTKSLPANVIAVGNPAHVLRTLPEAAVEHRD